MNINKPNTISNADESKPFGYTLLSVRASIPIFKIRSTFFVPRIYKKKFTIINREFNPVGASNSNCWYYTPSFDINRRIREDYLQELISGQLVLFLHNR